MRKSQLFGATFALIAAALLVPAAAGQSINFTVSTSSGPGSIVPGDSFGAAAGQPGYWNSHVGTIDQGVPVPLLDLNGDATGVTMTSSNQFFALWSTSNLPGASDDQLGVLAGFWDISGVIGFIDDQDSFTFTGLANGTYNVYTYAMAPYSANELTRVNVNADAKKGVPGEQVVGGAFKGDFEFGVTHALHAGIEVLDGTLVVNAASVTFGSIAGFQIQQVVPAPGALALLGMAGLCARRRRSRCTR